MSETSSLPELPSLSHRSTEFAVVLDPNGAVQELYDSEVSQPAKQFEFRLDVFQMQAVLCLERGQNVLVAAHTSAGKTVVADYAIAMAFRSMSRVIYTSPIKALSNQKYRDFKKEFDEVGLLTGDVQIDTESRCLIMTTEILLQMLYNRSQVLDDLEWVVFDECHYVNDPERGHVWEEVFILLPKTCNLVLLSATVPNVVQFADWLGRARNRATYVVSTSKRPVPLEHYLYVGRDTKTKNQRFKIVSSDGVFINDNYKEVEDIMNQRKAQLGYIKKCPQTERNIYLNLIRHLAEKDELPVICFTLSRNRCDSNLENLMAISKDSFQLTTKAEEARIHRFVFHHIRKLKACDQKLPQIMKTVEMLKRGLGVHHSGILPILKEITEILFSEGLVKVLVATETFAMGVNMPARTVVFDSIDKHDGNNWRDLKPSEYIQMAGRAGRRGKDKTGNVLILCKYDIPDTLRLCRMMQGSATELTSQFRLTYHMICNLHKGAEIEHANITHFLERSFGEHNRLKQTLEVNSQVELKKQEIEALPSLDCENCSDIENFYRALADYFAICQTVMPSICLKAMEKNKLNSGSIVAFFQEDCPFHYGVVLRVNKTKTNEITDLTVLSTKDGNKFEYKSIQINHLYKILTKNFGKKFDSKSIVNENEMKNRYKSKDETESAIQKLTQLGLTSDFTVLSEDSIDPKKGLQIKEIDLVSKLDQFMAYRERLLDFNCIKCKDFIKHFASVKSKMIALDELKDLEYRRSEHSLQFLPEYHQRVLVLKHLNYLNDELKLELKGRIACLMSEHELVITEMLLQNLLGGLTPEEIAALLSAFVFQHSKPNQNNAQNLTENLQKKKEELQSLDQMMSFTEHEFQVQPSSVEQELNFDLLAVVHEWAKGKPFVEVLELTEVQEGIIVRCIQRLDELLKYVKMAAKLMGNSELEETIESTSQVIRRDIVFCPSLYTIVDRSSDDKENDSLTDESINSNFL